MFFPLEMRRMAKHLRVPPQNAPIYPNAITSANIGITVMIVISSVTGVAAQRALICHKGHRLAYSRESKFSCDCGAGQSKSDGIFRPCGCTTASQAKLTKDEWKAEVVGKPSKLFTQTRIPSSKMNRCRLGNLSD